MVEVEAWPKVFPILRSLVFVQFHDAYGIICERYNLWPCVLLLRFMRLLSRFDENSYSRLFLFDSFFFFFLSNLIFFEEYRSQSVAERRLALQPQFTALDDGHKRNNCVYRYSPKVCLSSAEPQMEPIPPPKPRLKRPLLAPFQRDYVSDFGKSIILSVGRIRAKKLFGRNAILNFDD